MSDTTESGGAKGTEDRQAVSGPMNPGDEAPVGSPGSGEDVCPVCHGKGQMSNAPCGNCGGTGKINVGVGGA